MIRPSAAFLALALLATPSAADEPLEIVATIGMIADLATNVGGECVTVETLMGPGIDPHLYRATARDVQTLNRAGLILYSGYGLEGQLADVLTRYGQRVPTLAVSEAAIAPETLLSEDAGTPDPHLWMDVSAWRAVALVIADDLAARRPDCAEAIAESAALYAEQLDALHHWTAEAIATIPEDRRILVTAHDAFSYYGRAYGIAVAGIQGMSTQSEAGIADIRQTVEAILADRVPAIFVESTVSPRTVEAVIAATRQAGHAVAIGGELFSDAMGDPGTPEGTYIGMIHANTAAITQALGGTLPPLPEPLTDWAARWSTPR